MSRSAAKVAALPGGELLLVLALLGGHGVVHSQAAPSTSTATPASAPTDAAMDDIPRPDLQALEPQVIEQLQRARALWDKHHDAPPARQLGLLTDLAQLYHAYELWDAALACYRRAIALAPASFELQHLLGVASQQAGENEAAEQAFRAALSLQPDYPASALRLAEVLSLQNRRPEAIALSEQVMAAQPQMSAARLIRGELALAERAYPQAIALLNQVLQEVPQADRVHYLLAQAYRGQGENDLARQHLARRGSIGVRIPDPLFDRVQQLTVGERVAIIEAKLAYEAGDFAHAAERYRMVLQSEPGNIAAAANLGTSLAQLGDIDAAMEQFAKVLELAPHNLTAHFNLGALLLQHDQPDQARRHYQAVIEQRPQDREALLGLARSARALGDAAASIEAYQGLLQLSPERSELWFELAELLLAQGRSEQAGATLAQAYQLHPDDGQLAHLYAQHLLGVSDQSAAGLALALDLATRVFEARRSPEHGDSLARALAANGQCAVAAGLQRELLAHWRSSGNQQQIGEAEMRLQRYQTGPPCH